jgi:hypothetical protein
MEMNSIVTRRGPSSQEFCLGQSILLAVSSSYEDDAGGSQSGDALVIISLQKKSFVPNLKRRAIQGFIAR